VPFSLFSFGRAKGALPVDSTLPIFAEWNYHQAVIALIVSKQRSRSCFRAASDTVAGMFVAIFECEFGDAGLVEFAEAFCDHAVVLFLGRARQR
jgi:hypothetical protein